MAWFFLALGAAFFLASADALTKRYLSDLAVYEMGLARLGYTFPWLALALFFIPHPPTDVVFWGSLAMALPLEFAAFYCYMKALKLSPLSLSLPFLAFTPAFLILTGRLVLGESLSASGIGGIILIVAGSYCLNIGQVKSGLLEPVRAIFREPGSRLMLLVAILYSLTSAIGKLAIRHSSPAFFGCFYFVAFTLLMLMVLPFNRDADLRRLWGRRHVGIVLGMCMAAMIFCHMLAISMIQAAYMIAVKRTSMLFGVLYGAWLFREREIRPRLAGTVIMLAGVLLIAVGG